ncbi:MAG: 16S rRNA (guanine(527)-N(7))-methyltransferase RsmG [Actinomycetota bacterium]|nr:16S rRNA (guanine(527)-N(7))-methyltransferase RsmG [Actinomycetota bacterium]
MKGCGNLDQSLRELGIYSSDKELGALEKYMDMIYEYNRKVNLTGTKDKEGIMVRHILDSLAILKYKNNIFKASGSFKKILDVGTGAGLPGIPLSIIMDDREFYLLDISSKKINFLKDVIKEINLENVIILKGRAEQLAGQKKYRESFDVVVSRGVTKYNILIELTIPFCRINGRIVFYKSKKITAEVKRSGDSVKKLGGRISGLFEVDVPYLNEYRSFLEIKKVSKSPLKYPRSFNRIKKNPL